MRAKGTGGLLLAAGLAGASGLALESLLVSSSGLALGYGGSAAIGLATWLSAWALGAWCLRRPARSPARTLLALGGALALTTPLSVWVVLQAGDTLAGSAWAAPLALLSIAVPAFLQGAFMPELARRAGSVAALFAANLAGSLLGAWLIADRVAGSLGRPSAALAAAVAAALAGVIGAWSIAGPNTPARGPEGPSAGEISWAASAWIVGLGCAWMAASEWILLRLGVLWLGGMQNALNAVLCATLLALALGAALLPRCLPRGPRGVAALLGLAIAASLWPFAAPALMRATDSGPLFLRAAVLCVPALLPFGALVPVIHASTGLARESGERLGGLLLHEAWGAAIGIPLVHFVVVPSVGLSGAIAVGLGLALLALLPLVFAPSDRRSGLARLAALAALMAGVFVAQRKTPALDTPPFSNPALTVVSVREDRDFAVAVVDDGMIGERTLLTDGFRAAGTGRDYRYMEALGHLPLLLHPAPRRVAVLALGTGTTVGAVALHPEAERIDVLEISRAVVQAAPFFLAKNHGVLAEGLPGLLDERDGQVRIVVRLGDGRAALARSRAHYDVVTMEPLLPDSPFAVYLYTREFYAIARRALLPGGLVCQWVPPHALEPQTFDAVLDAFASSFAWSGAWLFGTQVLLVGADREPALVPARFPTGGGALADSVAALGIGSADDVLLR